MAQLNTSLADMPWLMQTSDPSEVIARGAAIGSQWAQTNLAKQSLAQRKMEFDQEQALRRAQEERAAALFPLVQTLKQQEMTMKGLELQDVLEGRQSLIQDKQIVSRGRQVADEYLNQGDPLRAKSFILDMTIQTPRLRNNQAWQELMSNIDAAVKLGQEQEKINALMMRSEAQANRYTAQDEIAKARLSQAADVNKRKWEELNTRKEQLSRQLSQTRKAEMEAKLKGITSSVELKYDLPALNKAIEDTIKEFESPATPIAPVTIEQGAPPSPIQYPKPLGGGFKILSTKP